MENLGILKRIFNEDELKECLQIIHMAYKKRDEELGLNNVSSFRHSYLSYEELKKLFDNGIEMFGYYLENKIVGFVSLDIRENKVKIKDIVVLPEHQNKGIGRLMLDFVKDETIRNNKTKIILGMIYDNEKLRLWYENYGFNVTNIVTYPNSISRIGYMEYIIER